MNKLFAPFLPPWAETGLQPAFYDLESGTVLQQTARMYDKVNQLIRLFNQLSEETKATVEEYIAKFVELKDFVDDYFDNLDVQEEINNKLDQMVEDGTLQRIIVDYIKDKMNNPVEFLFNPQRSVNSSMYTETEDATPTLSKVYYVQTGQTINDNGYVPVTQLASFDPDITYYERTNYSAYSGECFVIKAGDKNIMIDTGGANRSEVIRQYLEENGIDKLDYLIITHYHEDHCGNLNSIKDYVDLTGCKCYLPLVAPVANTDPQKNTELMAVINSLGLECVYPDEGDTLQVNDLIITFYNCGEDAFTEINAMYSSESDRKVNDYSMVCLVNYFDTNVLYSADIQNAGQRRLHIHEFFKDVTVDLYKWQHHGVNSLNDIYLPYLEEVAPKEVVIVGGDVATWEKRDTTLLKGHKYYYAWNKTLKWTSNGNCIKKTKETSPIFEFKNIPLLGGGTALNNYIGFLKFTNVWYYRTSSILFRIADTETGKGECLAKLSWHTSANTLEINEVKIENISSSGSVSLLSGLRVVTVGNEVYLFFQKFTNSIIPVFSIIDHTLQQPYVSVEPIEINLSSAEFESSYTSGVYSFNNLNNIEVESPFTISSSERLVWKKKNGVVDIIGSITTTADIPAAAEQLIAYLPDDIAAEGAIQSIQQSNQLKKWTAQLSYDSGLQKWKLMMTRYGTTDFATCPTGAWLPIHITYLAKN